VYFPDQVGSARDTVEVGSLAMQYEADYAPYGFQQAGWQKSGSVTLHDFRFAGMFNDPASNEYLTPARLYSYNEGRFMHRDPLAESAGVDMFAYAGGNPISSTDPSGLLFFNPADIFIGAVSGGISGFLAGHGSWQGTVAGIVGGAIGGGLASAAVAGRVGAWAAAAASGEGAMFGTMASNEITPGNQWSDNVLSSAMIGAVAYVAAGEGFLTAAGILDTTALKTAYSTFVTAPLNAIGQSNYDSGRTVGPPEPFGPPQPTTSNGGACKPAHPRVSVCFPNVMDCSNPANFR
jgi:RHS repeat-associated protein